MWSIVADMKYCGDVKYFVHLSQTQHLASIGRWGRLRSRPRYLLCFIFFSYILPRGNRFTINFFEHHNYFLGYSAHLWDAGNYRTAQIILNFWMENYQNYSPYPIVPDVPKMITVPYWHSRDKLYYINEYEYYRIVCQSIF